MAREGKLKEKEIAREKLEKRDGLVLGATAGSGGSGLESAMVACLLSLRERLVCGFRERSCIKKLWFGL